VLLEVGRIVRAHGLRGQVVVELTTNRSERVAPGSLLDADGRTVEVVASATAPAGTGHDRWLVTLDGVVTREAADALRGATLRAEAIDDPDVLWFHELIGARVVEVDGTDRGLVADVLANPASDLLELESGALVPLRFVVTRSDGVLTVDAPDGLFEQ
jgi:16S rRNA processing protein RimM